MNNKNEIVFENINLLIDKLIIQINNLDINNKHYLYKYRLDEFKNLQLCKCKRCNSYFIPMHRNNNQSFCNDHCRYGSTKSTRSYKISNDIRFRKIDNLRKAIYERKYRAKITNKKLPYKAELNLILLELKTLLKNKDELSLKEFNLVIKSLRDRYKQASRMN